MGTTWTYCKCGAAMRLPSLREAVLRSRECPRCGHKLEVQEHEVETVVDAFMERIDTLEKIVKRLAKRTSVRAGGPAIMVVSR